jgi:hypothetical protein
MGAQADNAKRGISKQLKGPRKVELLERPFKEHVLLGIVAEDDLMGLGGVIVLG